MTHFVPCMGLALSLALCGCREAKRRDSAAPERGSPQSAARLDVASGNDPASARLPLRERLAREASSRPAQAVRPEQLRGALESRGVALARTRQVLAAPVGAAYCETVVSAHGLGLSLCEYADDAAAEAGRKRSRELFDALVPGRTLIAHGGSLLTLTQPADERAAREVELVANVFGALAPAAR